MKSLRKIIFFSKTLNKYLFLPVIKGINQVLRKLTYFFHGTELLIQWHHLDNPEWMDHHQDMFFQWRRYRNSLWLERGVFNSLAVQQFKGPRVLDLCCGDGFNSYYFYSKHSADIIGVDFDKDVIKHANKFNKAENIQYEVKDIRDGLPDGEFNNIIWDAAIEHFTETEIQALMESIKDHLTEDGILSGYTVIDNEDEDHMMIHQHEYEFKSKQDLMRFLKPYFHNVKVFQTNYPERQNLYFYASNSVVPFTSSWKGQIDEARHPN